MILLLSLAAGAALLLVGSGLAKLRDGAASVRAIRVLLPRAPEVSGPAIGVGEVAIGVAFLVLPGRATGIVLGVAYLGLCVFAVAIRWSEVDCGCFGATSVPVSGGHLVVTGGAASVGLALALFGLPPLPLVALLTAYVLGVTLALLAFAHLAPLARLRAALATIR